MRNVYTFIIGLCLFGITINSNGATNFSSSNDYQIFSVDILSGDLNEAQLLQVLGSASATFNVPVLTLIQSYRSGGVLVTVNSDPQNNKIATVDYKGLTAVVAVGK